MIPKPKYQYERLRTLELIDEHERAGKSFNWGNEYPAAVYDAILYCYGKRLIRYPKGSLILTALGRQVLEEWRVIRFAEG